MALLFLGGKRRHILPSLILIVSILASLFVPYASAAPIELFYDDGNAYQGPYGDLGRFAGVRFSLPNGVSSARLLSVSYSRSNVNVNVMIHVTSANGITELGSPFANTFVAKPLTFQSVDVPPTITGDIVINSADFWVVIERLGPPPTPTIRGGVTPDPGYAAFDQVNDAHRSYFGPSLEELTDPGLFYLHFAPADYLIRAVVDPDLPGPQHFPPSSSHDLVNYGIAIVALSVIVLVAALAVRKRQRPQRFPPVSARYCPNCRAVLKPGGTFCTSCGKRVNR